MNTTILEMQFVTEIAKHVHRELRAIVEGKLVEMMEVSPVKVRVSRVKDSVDYRLDFTAARMGDTNFFDSLVLVDETCGSPRFYRPLRENRECFLAIRVLINIQTGKVGGFKIVTTEEREAVVAVFMAKVIGQ